jgi:outer membrane protein
MFNAQKTLSLIAMSGMLTAGAFAQAAGAPSTTASAATPATTAAAAPAAGNRVGVINIRAVIASTNEGRRDFEQLQKAKIEPKAKEVEGLRTELETLKGQLQTQGEKLADAERATRVRAIEQKEKNLQRIIEDAQKEIQDDQNQMLQRIGTKLMQVVDQYAKQNGFAMVLDATGDGPVLWASETVNISQPVLDMYNKQSGVPAPAANAPSATKPNTPPAPAKKPTTGGTTPR